MHNLHKPLFTVSFIFGLLLMINSAHASVGWLADSGQLTGATGVNVNGVLYNVTFVDDTCINAFDGCDSVDDFAFKTQDAAELSIIKSDYALLDLDNIRSDIGSVQQQLESTIRNISVTQVNVQAAESQIRDVDFAAESANFSKLNILAQSGSYALSQANAVQQNVLRLLQ